MYLEFIHYYMPNIFQLKKKKKESGPGQQVPIKWNRAEAQHRGGLRRVLYLRGLLGFANPHPGRQEAERSFSEGHRPELCNSTLPTYISTISCLGTATAAKPSNERDQRQVSDANVDP